MATMAHPIAFAERRHHPITTATLVLLFWLIAVVLVIGGHAVDRFSSSGGAAVAIAAIVVTAWLYTRLCACTAGSSHALGVGITWLVLTIVTEMAVTTRLGHGWYALIGSPARPLLRSVFLFVWVFAPALFAHRELEAD
ncbi:MAG TPA: hypothetical protein VHW00_03230 [Thermoanaerobaculia bacterium]|nr:hypothetical protein [Thermoanaerobaculia bacterium]